VSEFGEAIKEAKRVLGASYGEIAYKAKMSASHVIRIANGNVISPNKRTADALVAAIVDMVDERIARMDEKMRRMRAVTYRLKHVEVLPRAGHKRWEKPPAAQFLEVFCAAMESGGIEGRWLESEADVSYETIINFVRGKVLRPHPITAKLLGIAVVRRLNDEADKAWTKERHDSLLALAQGVKDAYKADYGDDLV
jgi:transcriptional regulator with XRE-family HTH domain